MRRGRSGLRVLALGAPLLLGALVACGDDSPGATQADPDATGPDAAVDRGRELARTRGCAACHGADGEGGLGPEWTGLVGSIVTLEDGSTLTADEAYITESIVDPAAHVVDGFTVSMPPTDLSDAEVADLVAYIGSLSG